MDKDEFEYCHYDDTDEYHDCLDYMECEECPYYYTVPNIHSNLNSSPDFTL